MAMKDLRRVLFCLGMILLFGPMAFAASTPGVRLAPACGLDNVKFSVHLNDNPPQAAPPQPGKALVYFIQDGNWDGYSNPTTRIALDGNWVGANHGVSYFSTTLDPGEHHACALTQSSLLQGQQLELAHFTAEAGRTYYFRMRLIGVRSAVVLDFEPVDSDQGAYMAATFPLSESKPK
jgi:hypothetical protein